MQTDGVRFRGALEMNNLYEKAFLYHKHCLKESEEINSVFLKNYEETAKTLFDECVAVKKWSPARAHDEILNRRAYLSHLADTVYAKSGCASRDALNVARYYRAFSSTGATDIK